MSDGIAGSTGNAMDLLSDTGGSSTRSGPDIHMADINDPEFTISYGDQVASVGGGAAPGSAGEASAEDGAFLPGGDAYGSAPAGGELVNLRAATSTQSAMTCSGRAAVAGAALFAGAGLVYLSTKPKGKRKRKKKTRGQKISYAGLIAGGTILALSSAAYLTSRMINNKIKGCRATDLFC